MYYLLVCSRPSNLKVLIETTPPLTITPHEDWPRPPTFVGGGIRWTRSNKPTGEGRSNQ